ncbi:MAG: putative acyl-CoA dehydrogenase FadE10 [Candidatus Binatia bacterium]|nr:MAG: putative acyl-CoA dehydrogenase FadE10 [Candidatus Binatia bacterium]
MDDARRHVASEEEARQIAEESREKEWAGRTFLRELFLGNFLLDLVHPFPVEEERPEFRAFYDDLKKFLQEEVDPRLIDETGEYPEHVIEGLRKRGCFGLKIPKEYGGLGFSVSEYTKVMELVGSYDGNLCALLSAHQSIGVPQPLKLFGTEEQKRKYLTRCAKGAISAFALTEPDVGSDPSSLQTTVKREGDTYILNGEKLWCTNGTLAELLVVMARDVDTKKISAFIVETDWPGVKVEHRCRFMGLKALANGVVSFRDVRVPRENLIGEDGKGLKVALVTLNTGRLTLPAVCAGIAKHALEICRGWCNARVQWGVPIGKHEAIAHRIADMAALAFAMDSVSKLTSAMADRGGYDIRLEAAAAKEWNTVRAWEIADQTLQIRGGRGYETERSLEERGETPIPVERVMRDCRINLVFEGSSEIMHLFMAREAVDKHLEVAGALIDPKKPLGEKLAALPAILGFYARWYPPLWFRGLRNPFLYRDWGPLGSHLRFIERAARRLARASFHGMALYQARMQRKQGFLFRCVDVVMELYAMAASISHARRLEELGAPEAAKARELVDLFCRNSRRKIRRLFRDLWSNEDDRKNVVASHVLRGDHVWLEKGAMGLGLTPESFRAFYFTRSGRPEKAPHRQVAAAS